MFSEQTRQKPPDVRGLPGGAVLFWLLAGIHLVCPLLFFTDLTRNPYFTQISLLESGLVLCFGLLVLFALVGKKISLADTPLSFPLGILLFALVLSWGISFLRHPPFRESIGSEGTRVTLFWIVNCMFVFWLAVQMKDPVWDGRFLWIIFAVAAAAGGYGILQYLGHEFIWPSNMNPYGGRPVSTFGNPNFLSSYLVMVLPLSLAEGLRAKSFRARWACTGVFLISFTALVCTMTRSSWVGGLVALGGMAWGTQRVLWRHRWWVGGMAGVVLFSLVLWPSSPVAGSALRPVARVADLLRGIRQNSSYGSWRQRVLIWSCARDMVDEKLVLGKGWGCFELFYPFYQGWYLADKTFHNFRTHANNAHNLIMEFWSQAGFLGLGLFIWVFVLFFALARRRIPLLPEENQTMARAMAWAVAGMLVDNFFGNVSLFFVIPAFLFWWLAGRLTRDISFESARVLSLEGAWVRAAGACAVILCGGMLLRTKRHWRAEVDYFAGFKRAKEGNFADAIEFTERSHALRRLEVNNNYEMANAYARQSRWAQDNRLPQESKRLAEKSLWGYDEALAANAGYDEIYFNKAAMLTQLGRTEDAVLNYRMALLINPLSLEAYKALGNLYLLNAKYWPAAADLFERAVFYYPRDKDLWNNLGYVYTRVNDNGKAVAAYGRAIRLDFNFDIAWKNLRVALGALGRKDAPILKVPLLWDKIQKTVAARDWTAARRAAEELSSLAPDNSQAGLLLGNLLAQTGDLPSAVKQYEKVLAWEPGWRDARINLAKCDAGLGKRDAALQIARALLREKPQDAEVAALVQALEKNAGGDFLVQ